MNASAGPEARPNAWAECRFLSCSVLPVRMACDLRCPFCFSKSSISALAHERRSIPEGALEEYLRFAAARGATRLVVTGGGEPLLRPELVLAIVRHARRHFDEVTCFTNGTRLTPELARRLGDAGLSYLCWSRHAVADDDNRALMGPGAPLADAFLAAAAGLRVRATCVMTRGWVESRDDVARYIDALSRRGVREFTFKHTYTAYPSSHFRGGRHDRWAEAHRVDEDPFEGQGTIIASLPWGPAIRRIGDVQVCFYREPTPQWELDNRICRSSNLLSDGRVYASLEDERSLLFRLPC